MCNFFTVCVIQKGGEGGDFLSRYLNASAETCFVVVINFSYDVNCLRGVGQSDDVTKYYCGESKFRYRQRSEIRALTSPVYSTLPKYKNKQR